jgi:hypothetical protein
MNKIVHRPSADDIASKKWIEGPNLPTRINNCIDLIYWTNNIELKAEVKSPIGNSDHKV